MNHKKGATFHGKVSLLGAEIDTNLECDGSTFIHTGNRDPKDNRALSADGIRVKGSVFLREGATFQGEVRLPGAEIGGTLECRGSTFANAGGAALNAERIQVKGGVFLSDGAMFQGKIQLLGAEIDTNLECDGSTFINTGNRDPKDNRALSADGVRVKGSVFLREGATFQGEVRLLGAEISGTLDCSGSTFTNQDSYALSADRITVKGSVFLNNQAMFQGEVRLLGAEINGDLDCDGSTFSKPDDRVLELEGITVQGNVFLHKKCVVQGTADFTNAKIGSHFVCKDMGKDTSWSLRLSHARVGVLWDDRESWPEPGRLWLDGFQYDRLDEKAKWDCTQRLGWLARHKHKDAFNPQPYEQLAAVFREAGHEADAKEVLIAKNWKALKTTLSRPKRWVFKPWKWASILLNLLLGAVCAFGYKPFRAAGWWLALWGFVWWRVIELEQQHCLVPTVSDLHARELTPIPFTASGYAFDLLTPIFDMGYTQAWTPVNTETALFLLGVGTAGYILVALFAASITGLIRR